MISEDLLKLVQQTRIEMTKKKGYLVSPNIEETKQTLEALMIIQEVLKENK